MTHKQTYALAGTVLVACFVIFFVARWFGNGAPEPAGSAPVQLGQNEAPLEAAPELSPASDDRSEVVPDASVPATRTALVVDSVSEEPVPGATLEIVVPLEGKPRLSSVADSRGIIPFDFSLERNEHLRVRAPGFFPTSLSLSDWTLLTSRFVTGPVVVPLAPTGVLIVRVEDEKKTPIAGAFVRVYPSDEQTGNPNWTPPGWPVFEQPGFLTPIRKSDYLEKVHAGTDENGELRIDGLPAGRRLHVHASGPCADVTGSVKIQTSQLPRVTRLVLVTTSSGTLTGRVIWDDGTPAADQHVEIYPPASELEYRTTNELGEYRFSGVPAGNYAMQCRAPLAEPLVVKSTPGPNALPDIVIRKGYPVRGTILSAQSFGSRRSGTPGREANNSNLHIAAYSERRVVAELPPDHDGTFEFSLPKGTYWLHLVRRGAAKPLKVVEVSAPSSGIEISIDDVVGGFHFTGVIEPAAQAKVWGFEQLAFGTRSSAHWAMQSGFASSQREIQPDENGVFRHGNVPGGTYDILVDFGVTGNAWTRGVNVPIGQDIDLGKLEGGFGALHGTVRTGLPEAGVPESAGTSWPEVGLASPTREELTVQPDEHGAFTFPKVRAGPWLLFLRAPGADALPAVYCDVYPGVAITQDLVCDGAFGTITGTVHVGGQPHAGIRLRIGPADQPRDIPSLSKIARETNDAGVYQFSPVLPGTHLVAATLWTPGSRWVLTSRRRVDVVAGQTATLDFDLVHEGIEVIFRDKSGIHTDLQSVTLVNLSDQSIREVNVNMAEKLIIPLFEQDQLVMWKRFSQAKEDPRGGRSAKVYCAVVSRAMALGTAPILVEAETGSIEVTLSADATAPRLWLESVRGVSLGVSGSYPELMCETVSSTKMKFLGVPQGAMVRVEDQFPWGREPLRVERGIGPSTIRWP